jgi:hypothetical protein
MPLQPNLINHANRKPEPPAPKELVRFPGFNECKDPQRCMEFMTDIEKVDQFIQTTPQGYIARGATESGRQQIREQIKRKFADDLKQILTEHPRLAEILKMSPAEVAEWTPEKALSASERIVDVPGDYRKK